MCITQIKVSEQYRVIVDFLRKKDGEVKFISPYRQGFLRVAHGNGKVIQPFKHVSRIRLSEKMIRISDNMVCQFAYAGDLKFTHVSWFQENLRLSEISDSRRRPR